MYLLPIHTHIYIYIILYIYLLPIHTHIYIYTCMKCISHTIHTNPSLPRPVQWRTPTRCLDTVCMEPFERGLGPNKYPLYKEYMSNEQNPGWLGYIGDYTTQLYRDSKKPL